MSKPIFHAMSSAKRHGGVPEDYLDIHQHMDSTKGCMADNRHRAGTHQSWYISPGGPLELIFGVTRTNSEGKMYTVRDIGEQHIAEDFGGYIPSLQDWLENMEMVPWMNNGRGVPSSQRKIVSMRKVNND